MEISSITKGGIRIKAKNTTISIDPVAPIASDIIISTSDNKSIAQEDAKLVIVGPGEYEVGGVHVNAQKQDSDTIYKIFDDQYTLLLLPVTSIKNVKEDEDYDAIIIHVTAQSNVDMFGQLSSEAILLYGDEQYIPKNDESLKKLNKVNLKKKDEVKGSLIFLS